jgi:hypothetical protein
MPVAEMPGAIFKTNRGNGVLPSESIIMMTGCYFQIHVSFAGVHILVNPLVLAGVYILVNPLVRS